MRILDNISDLFGDDLKGELGAGKNVSVAAGTFSIHAYAALQEQPAANSRARSVA